jgi:hypothetical protein
MEVLAVLQIQIRIVLHWFSNETTKNLHPPAEFKFNRLTYVQDASSIAWMCSENLRPSTSGLHNFFFLVEKIPYLCPSICICWYPKVLNQENWWLQYYSVRIVKSVPVQRIEYQSFCAVVWPFPGRKGRPPLCLSTPCMNHIARLDSLAGEGAVGIKS